MENPTKEQVIHRAYELWEQAGKPEGKDQEFYHQAEQELRNGRQILSLAHPRQPLSFSGNSNNSAIASG